ncbi:MAG: tetratricopeptide repeat protein [Bacteroidetes bacterium]|nr:MAG: tetratricopeptide repeat protein [Bacteroidota bacterium]
MRLFIVSAHLLISSLSFAQQNKIDTLLSLLKKDNIDTNKVIHLNKLSWEYKNIGNYDTALYYGNTALQLSQQLNFKTEIAAAYNNIRSVHYNRGNYPQAIECALKALKIYEEIKDKRGIATILNNIAGVYWNQGDAEKALDYNFKALQMREELGDKNAIAASLINIGSVYLSQGGYSKALDYYFKGLKIAEEIDNKQWKINALTGIGNIYDQQKDYSKALDYFLRALEMAELLGDKDGIAMQLGNIGSIYTEQKKYKEAEKYLMEALKMDKEIGARDGERDDENSLSNLYEKTGRYQLALEHYKKAMALKDTLFNEEKHKEITRKEMNYEFEKKEAAIKAEQDKKEVITAEEKRKQHLVIYFISAGLVLLLFLIAFVVRGYRQKIRSNEIIALKNEEIVRQKANITGQEEERKRIAQELHDGVGGTLAGIKLNLARINSSDNIPELESVIINIGDTCKEIRTISHNLATPALADNSFIDVLKEVIRKFIIPDKLKVHFEYSTQEELNSIQKNIQADIYRIVQELLANITKHADASRVEIDISKQENELFLLVEDNGKGFDMAAARKGIGLKNIESRVKLLGGKMIIDAKTGRGTAVNIQIPLPI